MYVKQLSIFIENKKGHLATLTNVIKERGIDIRAISVFDTNEFGILRLVVDDPETALVTVRNAGYAAKISEILAVEIEDKPGSLNKIFKLFDDKGINIEYIYSFVLRQQGAPLIVLKVDKTEEAAKLLRENGVRLVEDTEVYAKGSQL